MPGGDARGFELFGHPQIKVRRVDADEDIGAPLLQLFGQAAADTQDFRQFFQHFGIAAHRQFFLVKQALEAFGRHARPADAGKTRFGAALADGADQVRAEQIAGRFAGTQGNQGRRVVHGGDFAGKKAGRTRPRL